MTPATCRMSDLSRAANVAGGKGVALRLGNAEGQGYQGSTSFWQRNQVVKYVPGIHRGTALWDNTGFTKFGIPAFRADPRELVVSRHAPVPETRRGDVGGHRVTSFDLSNLVSGLPTILAIDTAEIGDRNDSEKPSRGRPALSIRARQSRARCAV